MRTVGCTKDHYKYRVGDNAHRYIVVAFVALAVSLTPCLASPHVFWASDPISSNETALVAGDELQAVSKITIERLANDPDRVAPPALSRSASVEILQQSERSIKFLIPKALGSGVYRYKLIGADGNMLGYLNTAEIYWVQGDQGSSSAPGGWIRIFGRDIARSPSAKLFLKSTDGRGVFEMPAGPTSSLWAATFRVPENFISGTYEASLWNGEGDGETKRFVGTVRVDDSPQIGKAILNVKNFGAVGDGRHDDTGRVIAAINALAHRGGGVLVFPRGRYLISQELHIPPHVTLEGEDRNLVSLNWPDFRDPPQALIEGSSYFSIRNLTIFASNYISVISGGFTKTGDASSDRQTDVDKNILISNVYIRASAFRGHLTPEDVAQKQAAAHTSRSLNNPVTIELSGKNLSVVDCDIYGSGSAFLLLRAEDAYVARNKFYNGRGSYFITGAKNVIFENNEITGADLLSRGGGINTLSKLSAFSKNVYFAHNVLSLMHGWDREALTTDGPGGYYFGRVEMVASDKLRLLGAIEKNGTPLPGAGVFVVSGRGTGQYAEVTETESDGNLSLDRSFAVLPDTDALLTIVPIQENYLIIGNSFSDAGVAVQLFGTAINEVIADNTSERTSGFVDKGLIYKHFQPNWYNQFLDNEIVEGNTYDIGGGNLAPSSASISISAKESNRLMPPIIRDIIIRGNEIQNNGSVFVRSDSTGSPGVVDVVVENNRVSHSDNGIIVDAGACNVLVRNNLFKDVKLPIQNRSSLQQ